MYSARSLILLGDSHSDAASAEVRGVTEKDCRMVTVRAPCSAAAARVSVIWTAAEILEGCAPLRAGVRLALETHRAVPARIRAGGV